MINLDIPDASNHAEYKTSIKTILNKIKNKKHGEVLKTITSLNNPRLLVSYQKIRENTPHSEIEILNDYYQSLKKFKSDMKVIGFPLDESYPITHTIKSLKKDIQKDKTKQLFYLSYVIGTISIIKGSNENFKIILKNILNALGFQNTVKFKILKKSLSGWLKSEMNKPKANELPFKYSIGRILDCIQILGKINRIFSGQEEMKTYDFINSLITFNKYPDILFQPELFEENMFSDISKDVRNQKTEFLRRLSGIYHELKNISLEEDPMMLSQTNYDPRIQRKHAALKKEVRNYIVENNMTRKLYLGQISANGSQNENNPIIFFDIAISKLNEIRKELFF